MTKTLTIVAHIEAKKDKVDLVKSELTKLIEPTLNEEGCIQYDLHQDNDNPSIFLFFENWKNRELWQDHMKTDHIKAYQQATGDAIEHFKVNEMTQVANFV